MLDTRGMVAALRRSADPYADLPDVYREEITRYAAQAEQATEQELRRNTVRLGAPLLTTAEG